MEHCYQYGYGECCLELGNICVSYIKGECKPNYPVPAIRTEIDIYPDRVLIWIKKREYASWGLWHYHNEIQQWEKTD